MPGPLHTYRLRLVYSAAPDGESWSLTSHNGNADTPDNVQLLADVFNSAYLAVANERVKIVSLSVSEGDLPDGIDVVYPQDDFTATVGAGTNKMVPVGEYMKAQGVSINTFTAARSNWHLHGLDALNIKADGSWDTGAAGIVALKTAANAYLLNYRKTATPIRHWPIVDPPVPFDNFSMDPKPYIRRLGRSFFVPGQTQRYQRQPTPSP